MAWQSIVHREGLSALGREPAFDVSPRGSLVVETRLAAVSEPQTILAMSLTTPYTGTLTLKAVPGGGVVLVISRRNQVYHATARLSASARTDILRITYSWDMQGGAGRLAIEWPERQATSWTQTGPAVPISSRDMDRLGGFFDLAHAHPDLIYAALSDVVEPIGPMPSIAWSTPIMTQYGMRPIQNLKRGDLVQAANSHAPQMVLSTIDRIVPALGSFAPVRLRAPYFGLKQDIIVGPDQRLLIGGSEVEYTFGCEYVLVPARHLINGVAATTEDCGPLAHYAHVILPEHAPIVAAGTVVESLFVGRARRNAGLLASSLLGTFDPVFLPEQARAPYPVLSSFEAIALAERRAA